MIPKKSFGQNFLTSPPARETIVRAGHLTENDTVLEIGPGKGFLTEGLLATGASVIAVEKDRELITFLSEPFCGVGSEGAGCGSVRMKSRNGSTS